ncbi:MAG TPA: CBS domain-containing protein [Noviherbaspirillum sp.]|nr:CBS domain-containing protein [Noviherbaspirillum sp.]
MPIKECCNIGVVCCDADATVPQVAELMRKHHVGDVIVVEYRDDRRVPVGIITDRDIVIEAIALQVDAGVFTAGDLMSSPVVTVQRDEGFIETLRIMRNNKIRRLPVVDADGALYGIVTADDVVRLLAMELSMMTSAIAEQPVREGRLRK